MKKDSEKKAGKTSFDPKDLVDKPIPNVYGPSPEKMRQRRREIEERNRQRRMQREREVQDCDTLIEIEKVYGPMPPTPSVNDTRKVNIEELVDMPTEDLYGPMPPGVDDPYMLMYGPMPPGVDDPYVLMYGPMPPIDEIVIPEKEGKDEDNKGEKEEISEEKRGFFARIFGNKHS